MITKKEVKYIQSLYHKKNRDEAHVFIAEGPKIVGEVLKSDFRVRQLYATAPWLNDHAGQDAIEVSEAELEKISQLQTPNQVLAVIEKRQADSQPSFASQVTLALDGIQDPGNLGTIIRIADWFGIRQLLASADTADLYSSKVVQASMGSFLRVECWYGNLQDLIQTSGVPVYGAVLNGVDIRAVKTLRQGILLIGNESKGIRGDLVSLVQHPITIAKRGEAESLNAAVAAGIILSHLVNGE